MTGRPGDKELIDGLRQCALATAQLYGDDFPAAVVARNSADRLEALTSPVTVTVKPLEWGETSYGTPEVYTVVGVYRLNNAWNGGWSALINNQAIRGHDGRDNFATVEDAKTAAQADYEKRILSALLPAHSGTPVE